MIRLSYTLDTDTPVYGNGAGFELQADRSMAGGDSCNTAVMTLPNHIGTHVDCPRHFDEQGMTVEAFESGSWYCHNIQLIRCDLAAEELCTVSKLQDSLDQMEGWKPDADAVLLVTGWGSRRSHADYWEHPPGITAEVAIWIRKTFPKLRYFGCDLISISSYVNREAGREAHRVFLCESPPVLILEDMDFSELPDNDSLDNLLISPIIIRGLDGAPCTVWANL